MASLTSGGKIVLSSILSTLTRILHFGSENLDLLAHDSPEQEVIKLMTFFTSLRQAINGLAHPSVRPDDHEEGSDESFL